MKLLICTIASLVLGHRVHDVESIGPLNQLATGGMALLPHESFMNTKGSTMTKWTGPVKLEIEERRKLVKYRQFNIFDVSSGARQQVVAHWKTHFNPYANERRSIRDVEGNTINRIHTNYFRRLRSRVRSFLTTPGRRQETFYTFNWRGWFGKLWDQKNVGTYKNVHTNIFSAGKGMCVGTFTNKRCQGHAMTAKSYNMGYKIEFFLGEGKTNKVATAELADAHPGAGIQNLVDKYLIGEKRIMTLEITSPNVDNLMIAEFAAWIMQYEWEGARLLMLPQGPQPIR
jgi:hypothetical protein